MSKFYGLFIVILLYSGSLYGQEFKINTQIRYRSEFAKNKNAFNAATFGNNLAADDFGLLRSRIGLTLLGTDNVSAFFQLQDSRKLGEETNTLSDGDADQFDLHQGYLLIGNFLTDDLSLKLGRMEILLGNQRIVGPVGWSNTGRSFDGALIERKNNPFTFSLFSLSLNEQVPTLHFDPDENFYGFYGTYKPLGKRTFNGYALLNENGDKISSGPDNDDSKLVRVTAGIDYTANVSAFDYEIEGAVQFVKQAAAANAGRDDISAFMLGLRLKYTFPSGKKPFIGAGYDFLSGDDDPADGDFKTFNTLFATNHKFYGFMDYFLNIPAATSNLGLQDFIVSGGFSPRSDIAVSGDCHYFVTSENNGAGNNYLGNELDLTLRYSYRQDLGFQRGISFFVPGATFRTRRRTTIISGIGRT